MFDKSFNGGTLLSFRFSVRTDRILFHRFGNYKSFSIMNHKRLKFSCRTFYNSFSSFHQIKHIHTTICPMQNRNRKPMPAGFNKLILMQTGSLFFPAFPFSDSFYPIEYFFFNPGFCTIPLNNFLTMFYIDRTWV